MTDRSVLRLFRFRATAPSAVIDSTLRDSLVPGMRENEGLVDLFVGRQGTNDANRRVIATVWESASMLAEALDDPSGGDRLESALSSMTAEADVRTMPIAISIAVPSPPEPPHVLRVFEGEVRKGEMEAYLAEARGGTFEDLAAEHGPSALYLAVASETRFATISTWTDWTRIEAATGGNIRRPIATRHARLLVAGGASHYEILPGTAPRDVPLAAPVD
jgi:hypothetical protein